MIWTVDIIRNLTEIQLECHASPGMVTALLAAHDAQAARADAAERRAAVADALTDDDKHDISMLLNSDAIRVLRRLNTEAAAFDGYLPDTELGGADTMTAWGLVGCELALQEVTGEYSNRDSEQCLEWGFAITSEGLAVLLLVDRHSAAAEDTARLDALEAALQTWWHPTLTRIDGGSLRIGDGDFPQAAISRGAAGATIRELADALRAHFLGAARAAGEVPGE